RDSLIFTRASARGIFSQCFHRPNGICASNQKRGEAERKYRMAEARAKVLPEGRSRAGVVRREEQREHENQTAETCGADEDAENERGPERQFAISYQEGDGSGVWKNEAAQSGRHEGVSSALEELVDPELKAAVKCEGGAENFVLTEDQEKNPYPNSEQSKRIVIAGAGIRTKIHRYSDPMAELPLRRNSRGIKNSIAAGGCMAASFLRRARGEASR